MISAFLAFHIFAITFWCIPLDSPLITEFRNLVRPYMLWSGLFQGWDTFAPVPKSVNSYIEAVVVFKDGQTRVWKFPRMEQLSIGERYYRERYRKFVEVLQQNSHSALWPDVARYIARLNNKDASNPPEIVILIEHRSEIRPYAEGAYRPEPVHARIFFEYNVTPEDLR